MSSLGEESDHPTVARRLSPRARTALAAQGEEDAPTVVIHRHTNPPAETPATGTSSLQSAAVIVQQLEATPERKLVRAAAPLLLIGAQLRNSVDRADVAALRRQVAEEMDRFQQTAQKSGCEAGDIIAARYVLCSMLDETVLMTPWGSRSEWSANSLLNQYHNETWGGEKVFTILDRVKTNGEKKLPLLLLIHACLMLGFEGRYRVLERGRDLLEELRNDLSRTIRRYSEAKPEEPLSAEGKAAKGGRRIRTAIPLWMVVVAAFCVLIIVHVYAQFTLSNALAPVLVKIHALTVG
ncbi:type IVB secretion system protein IcmH/DotU [Rhizobium jaguaris]|uniref:DotU family type IV/VI secretion system protein n=1 Tax=Rhizobium jaguaris TaxID=1312183 RepID=A0A387G1M2_9HYPH|nr:type IVB secretion system protein IcmH/DotU [Rhizobium jaguaris]AYG61912.1 DotU family type IV/VI secretion system protein [Rhizobium jaguaris]